MTAKIDIKLPDGVRLNRKIAAQILAFKSGIASGNADFINAVFSVARSKYFVDGARGVPYKVPPGANLKGRKDRRAKFVKGKYVNRTGQLERAFGELKFVPVNNRLFRGRNDSRDVSVLAGFNYIDVKFTGSSAKILGIDKAKKSMKRSPFTKALTSVSNNWKKLVKFGVLKKMQAVV